MAYTLLRHRDIPNIKKLDVYLENGGYDAFKKALSMEPDDVTAIVRASNLRGRGGAGFPAGIKWGFIPKAAGAKYIIINTDESETGTFKDRVLLEDDPHSSLEGMIIAGYAVGAEKGYIYIRGEYRKAEEIVAKAIAEAEHQGYLGTNILGGDFSFEIDVRACSFEDGAAIYQGAGMCEG